MTLIEKDINAWQLNVRGDVVVGEFKTIVAFMNQKHNVPFEEIETAVVEMIKNNHSRAEFGDVNKTFMFTLE
jgi:hypothetical protein